MSDIDNAVKPWALPLVKGEGRALHGTGQLLLAKWAILKTLIFDRTAAEADRTIHQRFYDALYGARVLDDPLPSCFEVFTARYGGSTVAAIAHTQPVEFRADDQPHADSPLARGDAYTATFTVAHLVLNVFGRDSEGVYEYGHRRDIAPAVRRIAPSLGPFTFPPGPSLTERGLSKLMGDALVL